MMIGTRIGVAIAAFIGVALATALAAWAGISATADALGDVGWLGLAWVCLLQLVSLALCAAAWRVLSEGTTYASCFTARWVRDGASNLVGIFPGVGEAAGARALALFGASAGVAAASSVVDVAVEALSQAVYILIGLVPLLAVVEREQAALGLSAAAIAAVPILATYLVTRHRGALELTERFVVRLAHALGFSGGIADLKVAHNVLSLSRGHRQIALALALHTAAWAVGAVQVWAAAQAMNRPLGPGAALALESLVYAARGALFVVPVGAGVQEGSFVLVGAVLGIDAAGAVALSLVLRARDALLGTPAVLLWYAAEGRERWLRRAQLRADHEGRLPDC